MIAYFDCFSGISGDMTLGALMHLGVPREWLEQQLQAIPLEEFRLELEDKSTHGITGKHAKVIVEHEPHARHYGTIRDLIAKADLSPWVKENGLEIFRRLAHAEAEVHGQPVEKVHFHEVGGTDAIADILGSLLALEYLGVTEVVASALPHGTGFVRCAHGVLPVPVPATVLLLKGCPTYGTDVPCELITPTGAAIISTLSKKFGPPPPMTIQGVGYGMGTRVLESRPNGLRIILGKPEPILQTDRVLTIETNIDDMNPEIFGYVQQILFEQGALDVAWIPMFMKKNRPATLVRVLCQPHVKDAIVRVLLMETTATGVRFFETSREKLPREEILLDTQFGEIRAKRITCPDGSVRITPEYDACVEIAREKNIPLLRVYEIVAKTLD
ncbi:MAG: nickel pincer cofactor biosynthesis protein LarC [Desulfatibacillum sp.]|nr:nickel pincer cofactor biosynthesis protein LarC [Desulfatibacillum sp.]